jgi:hypothetical protein
MGVLDLLRNAATVGAATYGGLAHDQQNNAARLMAAAKAQRDAENDRVRNLLMGAQTAKLNAPPPPAPHKLERVGGQVVDLDAGKSTPIEGFTEPPKAPTYRIENGQRINVDANTAEPVAGYTAPEPPKPNLSFQTVTPGDGQPPVIVGVDPKTGKKVSEVGVAKPTGSAAKLTEPQEKSYLFYNLMKNAEPDIDSTLASGKVRPAAITAFLRSGPADAAVNAFLNDDEQRLIRAARDFTAGVLRKESGAAITHDEIKQTLDRYFPGFGDQGPVAASKAQARKSYMQTMAQEATPAINYYARQKPAGTVESPAPAKAAASREQQLWDAAVAKYGEAKVMQEYGPRPPG